MVQEIYVPLDVTEEIGLELENTELRHHLERQMMKSYRIPHYVRAIELHPAGWSCGFKVILNDRGLSPREIDGLVESVQDRCADVLGVEPSILPDRTVEVR